MANSEVKTSLTVPLVHSLQRWSDIKTTSSEYLMLVVAFHWFVLL